jgi:hypothetical protein
LDKQNNNIQIMKKLTLGALALMLFLTTACKKNTTEPAATTGGGSATVTAGNYGFDGSATLGKFSSTKAGITQTTVNGVTTFTVSAIKDGSNESITIVLLQKITATGKIALTYNGGIGGIVLSKDYTKPSDLTLNYSTERSSTTNKGGGEINVTKLDGNTIEGTFYAIAYNNAGKEAFIEQGSFSGKIQ